MLIIAERYCRPRHTSAEMYAAIPARTAHAQLQPRSRFACTADTTRGRRDAATLAAVSKSQATLCAPTQRRKVGTRHAFAPDDNHLISITHSHLRLLLLTSFSIFSALSSPRCRRQLPQVLSHASATMLAHLPRCALEAIAAASRHFMR